MERGDLAEALRWADRAQRRCERSDDIAELKGRLLLRLSAPEAALAEFAKIEEASRSAAVRALVAEACFRLGRDVEGYAVLHAALTAFAVSPGDPLAECASRYCAPERGGPPGWIGLAPDLQEWGAFASRDDEGLVGGGPAFPPDFRLDGRCRSEGGVLQGWVRLGWAPQLSPRLVVRDRLRVIARIASHSAPGRHDFSLRIPRLTLGRELFVEVELPDGRSQALPTSPALIGSPPAPSGRRRSGPSSARRRPVDVIVPVYEGRAETGRCLDSILATAPGIGARLIMVNDASPNSELAEDLRAFARRNAATLLENPRNLGFPASVNRGLEVHPTHDAVILNADTEVYPGWLERLTEAAYSASDVGTVTPLSNAGAIASYPRGSSDLPTSEETAELDALAATVNAGRYVETPTGVGFCLYVRRDCLEETGPLDARMFGRGYGEENDFCLRAAANGRRHLIATDVFVRHQQSRSFGSDAAALRERNGRLLLRRHPTYESLVKDFLRRDPLHPARRRLDDARLKTLAGPIHLLVSLADQGGVDRVLEQRSREIAEAGGTALVLRPEPDSTRVRLSVPGWDDSDLVYDPSADHAQLLDLLRDLDLAGLELHHFLGHDSALIDDLIAPRPFTAFIHDHSWICPRLALIDGSGRYCGEPDLDGCDACVAANGSSLGDDISTADLRRRSARWLLAAERVVVPSRDLALRLKRYFPDLAVEVGPWEAEVFESTLPKPKVARTIKVAAIGAIGVQKGYQLLLDCARDAAKRLLPMEFVVVGFTVDDAEWLSLGNTFVTGRFDQTDIAELIRREAPDVALFASVTPETHCFSLSHALRARLPVVALDFGAIAERLRGAGAVSKLLPIDSGAQAINNALLSVVLRSHGVQNQRRLPPPRQTRAEGSDISLRVGSPAEVERAFVERRAMPEVTTGLTASPQLLTLGRGLYSFSVKSAAAPRRVAEDPDVVLPALHIAIAPGVAATNVEFMTGLRAEGAWLFDASDVLIAKVKVGGTSLLVTSYSAQGLPPLSIAIDRIDAQPDVPAQPSAVASAGPRYVADGRRVALQVDAHVSMVGDVSFADADWAGALEQNLPLEAFSIRLLERLGDEDIEYKALTAQGVETPWTRGGDICGGRGQAVPLRGLAVRLRGPKAGRYQCRYSARFRSGAVIGPVFDGEPVESDLRDDFLVGFQLVIVEAPAFAPDPQLLRSGQRAPVGPRFSAFREEVR